MTVASTKAKDHQDEMRRQYAPLVAVFSGELGQQALKLLDKEFVQQPSFKKDPYETAFREGQRSFVLLLKELVSLGDEDA